MEPGSIQLFWSGRNPFHDPENPRTQMVSSEIYGFVVKFTGVTYGSGYGTTTRVIRRRCLKSGPSRLDHPENPTKTPKTQMFSSEVGLVHSVIYGSGHRPTVMEPRRE